MIAQADLPDNDEVSVFALGTMLLRNRRRIARWMAIGAVLAALSVINAAKVYKASASFMPQGTDASRSMMGGLAGQLGITIPGAGSTNSADFYSKLLRSPVLLREIVRDSFTVGGEKQAFLDLFEVAPESGPQHREEAAVRQLQNLINISVDKTTHIVEFSVVTPWPSVSLAIAHALVNGVNEFNQRSQQGQAAAERKFLEGRLEIANRELRAAEDRLQRFLSSNRQFGSPQLGFERERLEREVELRQQVVIALTESYEEAQLREVRDTPLITVIEPPTVPATPEPRGRVRRVIIGLVAGGLFGALLGFFGFVAAKGRRQGSAEVDEFFSTLGSIKGGVIGRLPWSRKKTKV